jgi:hypothetical protein
LLFQQTCPSMVRGGGIWLSDRYIDPCSLIPKRPQKGYAFFQYTSDKLVYEMYYTDYIPQPRKFSSQIMIGIYFVVVALTSEFC